MLKKVFLLFFVIFLFIPNNTFAQEKVEYLNAKIVSIAENSTIIETNGFKHPYQKLKLLVQSGSLKDKTIEVENGNYNVSNIQTYDVGDQLVLTKTTVNNQSQIRISDYSRTTPLIALTLVFILCAVIIGGKRGFRSLLGMSITFVIIFAFLIPQITAGQNPVIITSISLLIIIPVSFLVSHGANMKTVSAVISSLLVLVVTGALSNYFIGISHLSGFTSEEASYLNYLKNGNFDARGLLFAGVIIALLGVLQDITISQAAVVVQLQKANNKLSFTSLFKRSMEVGRDHIASMTSTLILVYAGASLPLLLLFTTTNLPFGQIFNSENISEEIIRTLIASIGLMLAVPTTSALTALLIKTNKSSELNLA